MRWVYPRMLLNPTFSTFLHLNFCIVAYVEVVFKSCGPISLLIKPTGLKIVKTSLEAR